MAERRAECRYIALLEWDSRNASPNLWGTADLLNAYYKGVTQVADVGLFGAAIYIPALFVPILLTAHVLAFMLLLKRGDVVEHWPYVAARKQAPVAQPKDLGKKFPENTNGTW